MCRHTWLAIVLFTLGCSGPSADPGGIPRLLPVQGVVTVDGQPLEGAVVTFLPTDQQGSLTVAETNADGNYMLKYQGMPGTASGSYKVGISLIQTPEGKSMSLGAQTALSPPPGFDTAIERLPKKYSDLGLTVLTADVSERGGTYDFPLEGPLIDFPQAPEESNQGEELVPTSIEEDDQERSPASDNDPQ